MLQGLHLSHTHQLPRVFRRTARQVQHLALHSSLFPWASALAGRALSSRARQGCSSLRPGRYQKAGFRTTLAVAAPPRELVLPVEEKVKKVLPKRFSLCEPSVAWASTIGRSSNQNAASDSTMSLSVVGTPKIYQKFLYYCPY